MATSFAAAGASFWFNKTMSGEGTSVLVSSGAIAENDYGEMNPDDYVTTGSSYSRGIFSPLTEKERQLLPEGNRIDATYNLFLDTTASVDIANRVQISGTTNQYEVTQLFDLKAVGDANPYKKVRIVQLR